MKKLLVTLIVSLLVITMVGCGEKAEEATTTESADQGTTEETTDSGKLVVGFAQVGQESGWRDAESNSIKETAKELGIDLKFSDGQQKQENQIKAIRTFIQQEVDVIGLAPVVETGWDTVFQEAKDAGIPIILVDRKANVAEDLYAAFIGSDFVLEGQNAAIEMAKLLGDKGNVVELEGSVGASCANDRKKGFEDELASNHAGIKVLESQTGEFTRAKGKEVMEAFLKKYPDQINGVYAHNDDMALGAIEAIKDAGLKPGTDIKVVSIDGVKAIFEAMAAGEANVTVECNPLLGPQFYEACQTLKDGGTVEKWIKSEEDIYRQDTASTDLPNRKY